MLTPSKADRKKVLVNKLASIITEMNSTLENVFIESPCFQDNMTAVQPADGLYADNIEHSKAIVFWMARSIEIATQKAGYDQLPICLELTIKDNLVN
jgi:hypothetical protein